MDGICNPKCILLLSIPLLQAEPLVIDLKDLFQLIFNMKKKEQEAAQKVMCI